MAALQYIHCAQGDFWASEGDSICIEMKRKNNEYTQNGIIKSIKTNSITVQLYELTTYTKRANVSDTSKISRLKFLVLSNRVITIKPETVLRSILVCHLDYFVDYTLPYHLGFEDVYAIEKQRSETLVKGKIFIGTSKVLRSDFSPMPETTKLPLKDNSDAYKKYQFRCSLRKGFDVSISKKGGYTNRSFIAFRACIEELNFLFSYCKATDDSLVSSYTKKTSKLREERGKKVGDL
jgi:hypothetical protein